MQALHACPNPNGKDGQGKSSYPLSTAHKQAIHLWTLANVEFSGQVAEAHEARVARFGKGQPRPEPQPQYAVRYLGMEYIDSNRSSGELYHAFRLRWSRSDWYLSLVALRVKCGKPASQDIREHASYRVHRHCDHDSCGLGDCYGTTD